MEGERVYAALIHGDSQGRHGFMSIHASTDDDARQKAERHFAEETGTIHLYRLDMGTFELEKVVE